MKRLFSTVLTVAVILAAIAFVAAPYFGFFALRSAAVSQDIQGLAELVDYDAVRTSLRPQLETNPAAASAPPPSVWQDPLGALQHAIAPLAPAPQVDSYLTPSAMAALTFGEGRSAPAAKPADPAAKPSALGGPWPMVRYWGMNRMRLAVKSRDAAWDETVFTFERKGVFKWQLVHIGLPNRLPVAAPTPALAPATAPAH